MNLQAHRLIALILWSCALPNGLEDCKNMLSIQTCITEESQQAAKLGKTAKLMPRLSG